MPDAERSCRGLIVGALQLQSSSASVFEASLLAARGDHSRRAGALYALNS